MLELPEVFLCHTEVLCVPQRWKNGTAVTSLQMSTLKTSREKTKNVYRKLKSQVIEVETTLSVSAGFII